MALNPVVPIGLGLALLGFALTGKKSSAATAPGATPIVPATPPPNCENGTPTKGKSGHVWLLVDAGAGQIDVCAPGGSFGPHVTLRVLRYAASNRVLTAAASGVPDEIMKTAMSDLGVTAPQGPTVTTPPGRPAMPLALQQEMVETMMQLGVDSAGTVRGPVTAEGVRHATELASRLEQAGYPEAAAAMRQYAQQAGKMLPNATPATPLPVPGVPPDLVAQIQRALELERDPAKLEALRNALKMMPPSPQRDLLIGTLDALIVQIRAQQAVITAANNVDQVLQSQKSPGLPTQPSQPASTVPRPAAGPRMLRLTKPNMTGQDVKLWQTVLVNSGYGAVKPDGVFGPVTDAATRDWQSKHALKPDGIVGPATLAKVGTPPTAPVVVPPVPVPQPLPTAKSSRELAAERLATHLLALQAKYGVKGSKGKQDVGLTKNFQKEVGGVQDGLPGPGTMRALAQAGVGTLPKVMYWPKTATKAKDLPLYRAALGDVANKARANGLTVLATQIMNSAASEDGSGGLP